MDDAGLVAVLRGISLAVWLIAFAWLTPTIARSFTSARRPSDTVWCALWFVALQSALWAARGLVGWAPHPSTDESLLSLIGMQVFSACCGVGVLTARYTIEGRRL